METRLERSFRGISTRLAVRYLEGLGGSRLDGDDASTLGVAGDVDAIGTGDTSDAEAVVVAGEWTAAITSESVDIGPTLTLTEVTVVFEGDPDALEALLERFEQKAMRAGG